MNQDEQASLADLIPLEAVPRLLPTGTHRSTIFRWAQKGRRGIKLRVVTVGSTKCTTEDWLMEFFSAVEAARATTDSQEPACRPSRSAARTRSGPANVRTQEILRRHGL